MNHHQIVKKKRCSQCHSTNIARTVNEYPNVLVCLECGYRETPPIIHTSSQGVIWFKEEIPFSPYEEF